MKRRYYGYQRLHFGDKIRLETRRRWPLTDRANPMLGCGDSAGSAAARCRPDIRVERSSRIAIPIASFTGLVRPSPFFYDPSFDLFRGASIYPRQYLLKGRKELLPPALGTLVVLLLIR